MRARVLKRWLMAGLAICSAWAGDAGAKAPATLPVGACINLGNHVDMVRGEITDKKLGADDFRRIRAAGFRTVRLTVNWSGHSADIAPYAIDPAWMARISGLVDAALGSGLTVILNSHNFDPINEDPLGAAIRLAGVWRQIGLHFAHRPDSHLWFEIENEPNKALKNSNLLTALGPSLAAIRASNPHRMVIIGGENWSGIDSLATLTLPNDPQVWPTFHYYEPFDFTHQGASWVSPSPPLGRVYGTPDDAARLLRDTAKIKAYAARTGKVPLMGESGAFESIPIAQRVAYTRAVHDAFVPMGVGVCQWAYTNTFPFYDHKAGHWVPGMLGAIGLPEPR